MKKINEREVNAFFLGVLFSFIVGLIIHWKELKKEMKNRFNTHKSYK